MQQLKDSMDKLEIEKTEWLKTKSSMEAEVAQTERYKENLANFRKQYSDLMNRSRTTINDNAKEIKDLTIERDSLKAQLENKVASSDQSNSLSARIDALVADKEQVEASFAEEKARLEGLIQSERAKVAAATETISTLSQPPNDASIPTSSAGNHEALVQAAVDEAKRAWEEEKLQLAKARDEATEREKLTAAQSQKLAEDKAHLEASNVSVQIVS
ncbi:hypothetical protein K439DRAFT_123570 [Ramaria rubella]|nr:hypothetical protein K439DRAFT_123570 [Ramaria rubella]